MKTSELAGLLNAEIINLADDEREIESGYAGDFLSFVMGRASSGAAWFTVMNNVNVCAVATLADTASVVLCESVRPDQNMLEKAKAQGINVLSTALDIYNAVKVAASKI